MFANEIQARRDFTAASNKLQAAITAYTEARTRLHGLTGEFVGADQKATLQFTTAEGKTAKAEILLTDC